MDLACVEMLSEFLLVWGMHGVLRLEISATSLLAWSSNLRRRHRGSTFGKVSRLGKLPWSGVPLVIRALYLVKPLHHDAFVSLPAVAIAVVEDFLDLL